MAKHSTMHNRRHHLVMFLHTHNTHTHSSGEVSAAQHDTLPPDASCAFINSQPLTPVLNAPCQINSHIAQRESAAECLCAWRLQSTALQLVQIIIVPQQRRQRGSCGRHTASRTATATFVIVCCVRSDWLQRAWLVLNCCKLQAVCFWRRISFA